MKDSHLQAYEDSFEVILHQLMAHLEIHKEVLSELLGGSDPKEQKRIRDVIDRRVEESFRYRLSHISDTKPDVASIATKVLDKYKKRKKKKS